jgi:hypothetical protein
MKLFPMSVLVVAALSMLGGCASEFGKPTNITLEQALTSVGTGLAGMRAAQRGVPGGGGLIPQTVTVTFDVGASATDNGSLTLQASTPAASPVTASGTITGGSTITVNRSNQVSLTLTNILFAPNAGILADNPDTIQKLVTTLHTAGYDLYVVDDSHVDPQAKTQVSAVLKASQDRFLEMQAIQQKQISK